LITKTFMLATTQEWHTNNYWKMRLQSGISSLPEQDLKMKPKKS